jgi:gas vesicle protein
MVSSRPVGPEGQPLTPEEEVDLARSEARRSRRWAYVALFLALLAAIAGGVALVLLASEAEKNRSDASRDTVRELREDVRRLNEETETAQSARSEADTAEDRSRSLREQVEDLETRLSETNDRADATQRQVGALSDELLDDMQQLREQVGRLERDGGG